MAKDIAPKAREKNTTLSVSPEFAEVINELARAHGLTVRAYCDQHAKPKFAGDYKAALKAKLAKVGG